MLVEFDDLTCDYVILNIVRCMNQTIFGPKTSYSYMQIAIKCLRIDPRPGFINGVNDAFL